MTWLIHDVDPWRTDRVVFEADGTAVVETTNLMAGQSTVRRKLDKPVQLTALLTTIGLRGPAPSPAPGVAPVAQRTPVPAAVGTDARWEWGIGGVLVGLAAAGLVVAARRVRAAR
ncbi:hypothetical protein ACFQV2_14925 [Actinokineospora soli]|uniref:Uncharacterized protein n=1 Tax=Actinokineospora soli TaxID=1048753 RepID=A0ABW2TMN2_9PSEU